MRYVINITKNKTSKDGSILGKVLDFKNEMTLHEQSELNVYKKHPQLTACNREVTIYNRYTQQKVQTIMFGSNSYLGATIFPEAIQKAIEVTKELCFWIWWSSVIIRYIYVSARIRTSYC